MFEPTLYMFFSAREQLITALQQELTEGEVTDKRIESYRQEIIDYLHLRAQNNTLLSDIVQTQNYRLLHQSYRVIDDFFEHKDLSRHKHKWSEFYEILDIESILYLCKDSSVKLIDKELNDNAAMRIRRVYLQRAPINLFGLLPQKNFGKNPVNSILFQSAYTDEYIDKYSQQY